MHGNARDCTGMLVTACEMHGNVQEYLSLHLTWDAWECTGILVSACGMHWNVRVTECSHGNAQEYLSLHVGLK